MEERTIRLYNHKNAATVFTVIAAIMTLLYANLYSACNFDEMYKYQACRAFSQGYTLYRDVNIITTPLYFIIMGLPLKINDTFLMFRILSAVMFGCIGYLIYLIIKDDSEIPKLTAIMHTFILIFVNYIAGYNALIFIWVLGAVYIYKVNGITRRSASATGFAVSLMLLTKQNVGIIGFIAFLLFYIIKNKDNGIKCLKYYIAHAFMLPTYFLIIISAMGLFPSFYDQCVRGMESFALENTKISMSPVLITLSLILASMAVIRTTKYRDMEVFHPASAILLFGGYPIADYDHLIYSVVLSLMFLTMAFGKYVDAGHIDERDDRFLKFTLFVGVFLVAMLPKTVSLISFQEKGFGREGVYAGMHETELTLWAREMSEKFGNDYGNDGYILISRSASPLSAERRISQGEFDIFLKGNIGTRTPQGCIDKALNDGKVIIIDIDYGEPERQEFRGIYEYLKENHTHITSYIDAHDRIYEAYRQ